MAAKSKKSEKITSLKGLVEEEGNSGFLEEDDLLSSLRYEPKGKIIEDEEVTLSFSAPKYFIEIWMQAEAIRDYLKGNSHIISRVKFEALSKYAKSLIKFSWAKLFSRMPGELLQKKSSPDFDWDGTLYLKEEERIYIFKKKSGDDDKQKMMKDILGKLLS